MKRAAILTLVLALGVALAGCGGGKAVGGGVDLGFEDQQSKSPTPTPSRTIKRSASATPTAVKTSSPPVQNYCDKDNDTLVIRNVGDGFDPTDLRVVEGCPLTFKNLDKNQKHSWRNGTGADENAGKLWSSPVLSYNQSWKWVVDAPPGDYEFHDGEVPYILGHLQVIPRPK